MAESKGKEVDVVVPQGLIELIDRFDRNRDAYRSGQYNETQVRREFIDPFFKLLGWDIDNERGYAEAYKDVIHEDAIKIGGATKAPDYCFRVGGARKFFLEAKKPLVNIRDDINPAFQLRRYAWSAKLPLSILTDFEEFAVYDCRVKPDKDDKTATGRVLYLTYKDYFSHWEKIADVFSRDAVLKGSFDKYAESTKGKRGTAEVDAAFLQEIERWREMLARNIALRNPSISQRELNFSVQNTIDRIIFLRICEDRGIEHYGQLQNLLKSPNIYEQLCQLFRRADDRYNSGLFHFRKEKARLEPPDELSLRLVIDDTSLKDILKNLYYPDSPYEFSVLPADILGQVYEQFLGKVIRLTSGHRAVVEDKPEVKKAGGVYYTPTYIVDYIVKNTVGKILEGKTPKQAAKLTILDPACGSGSFLIGTYQYLLDWYRDRYAEDRPNKHTKELHQGQGGDWRLTTAERKRILLNNIYGVDIDPQAVEVTKLSLLLKVLEGENEQTITTQLKLFQERALPDLGNNIKCGNSLIGLDFYDQPQMTFLDEEERYRVNVFDWKAGFPQVFQGKDAGFDVVIGNPPYLYSAGQTYIDYFNSHYRLAQYQTDFYVYFIERAMSLVRSGGKVSYIVSDSWLNSEYFSKLRKYLLTQHKIDIIAVFDYPVFKTVTLENSIFVITASAKPESVFIDRFIHPSSHSTVNQLDVSDALKRDLLDPHYSAACEGVLKKIENKSLPLEHYVNLNRGIHPYRTDGYGKSRFGPGPQTKKDKETCSYHADKPLDDTYLPELRGKDVDRFTFTPTGRFLSYGPWLAEPRQPEFFFKPKIAIRKILGPKLHGTFIEEPVALDQSLYVFISKNENSSELKHLLGILLSRIGAWYLRKKYAIYDKLYPWYTKKQLASFPVKEPDENLVALVDQILLLNKQISTVKTGYERTSIQRQIEAIDRQIDRIVYELYGLTDEEISIVEGGEYHLAEANHIDSRL